MKRSQPRGWIHKDDVSDVVRLIINAMTIGNPKRLIQRADASARAAGVHEEHSGDELIARISARKVSTAETQEEESVECKYSYR